MQYRDEQGQLRYGYVVKVDRDGRHLEVMDAMAYPPAPTPFGAWKETIAFEAVEIAGNGFDCLGKCPVLEGLTKEECGR
ncbi:hypothetical protein [Dictyobacter aurantiacus]|uniref:Uncharacterized protein n=1 Tax=Dictyobacter aurantiacus TaxID=1936993 RepID=A0A401Z737_9CHLR|nr:hypothetical protein [Dictyobacter aurantiacus]GCE02677.1 hypothetical protein KDAU_00060 [Dictyobacter aurantiacus]GCE07770.1 hypothetical protein KDAU_50990 [Dictyobacter aurantiacus]GCE07781.1 hypothetical protein KDAU_51100 [Dictyobacter aurantiacus]GCE10136.1 hypothetical protein KDAU_74650 [Dictyobacter aurantiacus]